MTKTSSVKYLKEPVENRKGQAVFHSQGKNSKTTNCLGNWYEITNVSSLGVSKFFSIKNVALMHSLW
jgi:hypothetical protein